MVYSARTYQWINPMPLINLSTYWTLWSMFKAICYIPTEEFPCILFEKLTSPIMEPLFESNFFDPTTADFLLKFSALSGKIFHSSLEDKVHAMTFYLAGFQTNNKSSDNNSMTSEICKNIYQRTSQATSDSGS